MLVHPESPRSIIQLADVVGSTTGLINAVQQSDAKRFIVATDRGIFYKMRSVAGDKELIEAPTAGKGASYGSTVTSIIPGGTHVVTLNRGLSRDTCK